MGEPTPPLGGGPPPAARRRSLAVSGLGGRTLLIIAALLMAIAAAERTGARLDLSSDHRFTIDPALRKLLSHQQEPIGLVGIWGMEDERTTEVLANDLAQMSTVSHLISWRHIDPDLNRPALEDFSTHHGHASSRGLYVVRGTRMYTIPVTPSTRLTLQREVGAALQVLSQDHPPLAVFLQGHGELTPAGSGPDGASACMQALALGNFNVRTLDSGSSEHLPATALLVLAGPRHDLGSAGIQLVADHLRDGGAVLACLDDQAPEDLCSYLRTRGVLVGSGYPAGLATQDFSTVLDPRAPTLPALVVYSYRHNAAGDGHSFPYPNLLLEEAGAGAEMINREHPACAGVASSGVAVLSPETSQVEAFSLDVLSHLAPAVGSRWADSGLAPSRTTRLLATVPGDAWRQRFGPDLHQPPGWDTMAGFGLAWAIEYPPDSKSVQDDGQGGRLVVWGSRQAISDDTLAHTAFANADLVRSLSAWLARRAPISTIPDTPLVAYHANLSEHGLFLFIFCMVIVLPGVALGGAMLTWWDRR
jgi:hypothetical protein